MHKLLPGVLVFLIAYTSCQSSADDPSPADCLLKEIDLFDSSSPNEKYTVLFEGKNIKEIKTIDYHYKFTYDQNGRLIRRESEDLSYNFKDRIEFIYNSNGQLVEEKQYENGSVLPSEKTIYGYAAGKIVEMKSYELPSNTLDWNYKFSWTGDNISKMESYDQGILICTQTYTYDLSKENNFNATHKYYYWQDPSDDYETISEALFFSKNILKLSAGDCSNTATDEITYTYNSKNKIRSILFENQLAWTFRYTCD